MILLDYFWGSVSQFTQIGQGFRSQETFDPLSMCKLQLNID